MLKRERERERERERVVFKSARECEKDVTECWKISTSKVRFGSNFFQIVFHHSATQGVGRNMLAA